MVLVLLVMMMVAVWLWRCLRLPTRPLVDLLCCMPLLLLLLLLLLLRWPLRLPLLLLLLLLRLGGLVGLGWLADDLAVLHAAVAELLGGQIQLLLLLPAVSTTQLTAVCLWRRRLLHRLPRRLWLLLLLPLRSCVAGVADRHQRWLLLLRPQDRALRAAAITNPSVLLPSSCILPRSMLAPTDCSAPAGRRCTALRRRVAARAGVVEVRGSSGR